MSRAPIAAPQRGPAAPLYRQLRPRPNGPPREQVLANQRARLCGAMIEAVDAQGYAAVSVAGLCRLAGVSKRTYYELFPNREACFRATYDGIVACARARILSAHRDASDWEEGLRAALDTLVRAVEERPKAARLAWIEAPAAGPARSERCDGASRELERTVAASYARAPHALKLPGLLATGVACGVEHVLRLGVLEHDRVDAEALAEWALSFASPALAALPRADARRADQSAGSWVPARAVKGSERSRVLRAAAEIVASSGRSRLSAASIARRAQVSEEVVLEMYPSIDACLLDSVELVGLEALVSIAKAARHAGDGPSRVCRAVDALMGRLAGDPVLRSVAFLEVHSPGAAGMDRRERLLRGIADLISKPVQPAAGSRLTGEATAGALRGILRRHVAAGAGHLLPSVAPQVAYLVLAPLLGGEAAVAAIVAELRERSGLQPRSVRNSSR
jgi:AcrR family transcriptional regulator